MVMAISHSCASCKVVRWSALKTGVSVLMLASQFRRRGHVAWLRRHCVDAGGGGDRGRCMTGNLGVVVTGVKEGNHGGAAAHAASSGVAAHVVGADVANHVVHPQPGQVFAQRLVGLYGL